MVCLAMCCCQLFDKWLVIDCHTEGRKSSGAKRTTRQGRGSPVKDGRQRGITDKSPRRRRSGKARAGFESPLKVAGTCYNYYCYIIVIIISGDDA